MLKKIQKNEKKLKQVLEILLDRTIPTNHTYTIDLKLQNVSQAQLSVLYQTLDILEENNTIIKKYKERND